MSNEFTDNELRSIALNAVGRTSEAGGKSVIRIGLAIPDGHITDDAKINYPPKGSKESFNSGFSVGVFQWDIGAKKNGKEIIEVYNNSEYVKSGKGKSIPEDKVDAYALVLQQNRDVDMFGNENSDKNRMDIRRIREKDTVNIEYREKLARSLNSFFNTDEGYKFIVSLQERQYETNLKPVMEEALNSKAVQSMSREDAVETLSAVAKLKNQANGDISTFIKDEKNIHTKQEIIDKIKATHGKYVDDGIDKTLKGAELYNTLYNEKGKLGEIFKEYNKSDPIDMTNFHKSPNDQLMDALFRQPEKAKELIKAVNNGKDYVINIEKEDSNMGIEKETYIVGVRNGIIFTMQEIIEDKKVTNSSKGYKLENNEWKEFDNNKERLLKLKNNDWSIDKSNSERVFKDGKTWTQICEEFFNRQNEMKVSAVDKGLDRGISRG
ncbi:MAG: hypothetical protein LBG21_02280 [Campylobacteraceae bacterium]|jgi:hypothetical protein|nr:hypothetical protein [Campylobacteraceae bacterium]